MSVSISEKVSLVEDFCGAVLGKNLDDILLKYEGENYGPSGKPSLFKGILNDSLSKEESKFLKEKVSSLKHKRDRRTNREYAAELVLGWIVEDVVLEVIDSTSLQAELNGSDACREFLTSPSSDPDFVVQSGGRAERLEQASDFTGFWSENKKMHLRDDKYEKVTEAGGNLLAIDFENLEFVLSNVNNLPTTHRESWSAYGGKPAEEVDLSDISFSPISKLDEKIVDFFKG